MSCTGDASNVIVGPANIEVDFVDLGYTKGGIEIRHEKGFVDVQADQVVGTVKKAYSETKMFIKTTLLEATDDNLKIAWGMASGSLNSFSEAPEHNVKVIGKQPGAGGGTREFEFTRAVQISDGALNMTREEESSIEVEFEALKNCDNTFGNLATIQTQVP